MTIEFSLSKKQLEMREGIRGLAKNVIRPQALAWDRAGGIPEEFLRNMARLATSMGSNAMRSGLGDETEEEKKDAEKRRGPSSGSNLFGVLASEELAWGDGGLLLCLPGPGLGGPPVRGSGTPEQKKRFFGMFEDLEGAPLKWGAYGPTRAATSPASARAAARTAGTGS
jgi:alkylation response protein AidB-like acyl-CoA dehydrogenase